MTEKPSWWPKNPRGQEDEEWDDIYYDGWERASDAIWEVVEKKLEEEFNEGYGCGSNTASENT